MNCAVSLPIRRSRVSSLHLRFLEFPFAGPEERRVILTLGVQSLLQLDDLEFQLLDTPMMQHKLQADRLRVEYGQLGRITQKVVVRIDPVVLDVPAAGAFASVKARATFDEHLALAMPLTANRDSAGGGTGPERSAARRSAHRGLPSRPDPRQPCVFFQHLICSRSKTLGGVIVPKPGAYVIAGPESIVGRPEIEYREVDRVVTETIHDLNGIGQRAIRPRDFRETRRRPGG